MHLIFILTIANDYHIQSIHFVLAFPQADIQADIYKQPPIAPTHFNIPDLPLYPDRFTKVYTLIEKVIWP